MKVLVIILSFILVPSICLAWDKEDTALQVTVVSLLLSDMSQTLYISSHDEYCELNSLLGERPSRDKVYGYFLGAIVAHTVVSYLLPKEYRKWWQGAFILVESGVVLRNSILGIGFSY
jgi:hypothetical protein